MRILFLSRCRLPSPHRTIPSGQTKTGKPQARCLRLRRAARGLPGRALGRQQDRKAASLADPAFDRDRTAVRLDKLLGDGQPQPAALHFGTRHAEITLENALMVTRVDAPSEILHENLDRLFMLHGPDDDARILGGMVDGVGEEVGDDPCDLFVVDEQFRYFFRILHFHIARPAPVSP